MKLEEKHIAPYMPYNVWIIDDVPGGHGMELEGIDRSLNSVIAERANWKYDEVKLILRPLSELTKEIKHNGRKFVPYETKILVDFMESSNDWYTLNECNHDISTNDIPYYIIDMLFEWHFDVFGLIPEGLAIKKENK